jgi:sigma-B regulation protein RsbU (phosphoserine phosphatase)
MARILVVDDNEMNRDMLSRRLVKRGHEVLVAEDGYQGLDLIEREDLDLVLLDIMMPGIDGLEVLERVRDGKPPDILPVIMATAKDTSEDVVQALKLGASDYVTKPFDFPVVLARVQTQLELKRSRDALAAAHGKMKRDLEAASRIQQAFLPARDIAVPGARFAWQYVPCDELAGDTLNVVPLDDDHVAVYVLDVSGHGVPAALLSVTLSRFLSGDSRSSPLWREDGTAKRCRFSSPLEVVDELARSFPYDPDTLQYFTLAYGVLDLTQNEFRYVSAGHVPPIRVREGAEPILIGSTGPPVGVLPTDILPSTYEEGVIDLEPGDRLYLYSDGIPEAHSPEREEYGEERLAQELTRLFDHDLAESIPEIVRIVGGWRDASVFEDDVTILAVELE